MIQLVHLVSGDIIIGNTSNANSYHPQLWIRDPMYVERTSDGGMRLRDVMTLSEDQNQITIRRANILFTTTPLQEMIDYYEIAAKYSKDISKVLVKAQILESAVDMRKMLEEDSREMSTSIRNSGGVVH